MILVLILVNRKKPSISTAVWAAIGGLTILNIVIAVFWVPSEPSRGAHDLEHLGQPTVLEADSFGVEHQPPTQHAFEILMMGGL